MTLDTLYALTGFSPNAPQRRAIEHVHGPLFLVAGPGSGKTRVLLWRSLNLIVFHGVKPEEIFLATFTEKAAQQLKDGLLSLIGLVTNQTGVPYDLSKMYVGTVHSLCQRILTDRLFSPGRSRKDAPVILDQLEQYFLVHRKRFWTDAQTLLGYETPEKLRADINGVFKDTPYDDDSRHRATQNVLGFFNRLSEENLEPATLLPNCQDEDVIRLLKLYDLYLDKLEGQVDLSLLQQAAYKTLIQHPKSEHVFKHVIVDEYQDTNAIQEKLYFALAGDKNICVVGDDEQALYRFRGATVENFVQFPERCESYLGMKPERIALATNYRSRKKVVESYTTFMAGMNWTKPGGGSYRIEDKGIHAASTDDSTSVVASSSGKAEAVCDELAEFVKELLASGKVKDPNQIAFLYPSLKSAIVEKMQAALAKRDLKVYAPRANRFLEGEEPSFVLGLMAQILGKPERDPEYDGGQYKAFYDWLDEAYRAARELISSDKNLASYVKDRKVELERVTSDYAALGATIAANGWKLSTPYDPSVHKRALVNTKLSDHAKRALGSSYLDKLAKEKAFTLSYLVNRATSLDWNLLDLFYRLIGFQPFKTMFDLAESGQDEGPICNLALVSQLISLFLDQTQTVLTAPWLSDNRVSNMFFGSYLFARWRLEEGEYEDEENPFPKGRIPFLTIHQSKGLEFPVVVLGHPRKGFDKPQKVEELVGPFLPKEREPLERVAELDTMRSFYVALSRAQNLLVLAHPKGAGYRTHPVLESLITSSPRLKDFTVATLPEAKLDVGDVSRTYSYTSDFLSYQHCPRSYMVFNKYGFAASRSQAMFFGSLVHQTIEDLHNFLIHKRSAA